MTDVTLEDIEKEYQQVQNDLKQVADQVKASAEKTLAEIKNLGDASAQTKATADNALSELGALQAKFKDLQMYVDRPKGDGVPAAQTLGQRFVNDEQAQNLSSSYRGKISVSMPRNEITSASIKVQPQVLPEIIPPGLQRFTIRDLLAPGTTSSNAVEYTKETGFTNNARPVAEGTAKPYSDLTFTNVVAMVKTIAHLFKASRQIMDDKPALQSYIDGRARYGLQIAEEKQLLHGDGTGANIMGIVPQATAYAAPGGVTIASSTKIDTIRLALLQAALAEFPASGIVLNPIDWAVIETTKDTTGRYIIGNPQGSITKMLWNVPVVDTQAQTLDNFLVGAFNVAAQIFDRMSIEVLLSTENDKDFENNMITIRAEQRMALAVYRPEAFVAGTFS